MTTLAAFFTQGHRDCDAGWAELEQALGGSGDVAALWSKFRGSLEVHLTMEEEVLFPAFEAAAGMTGCGPTQVMRYEHEQMRALLGQIGEAIEGGNNEEALDQGDTLLMLIQQHNQKEEGILYPMAEQVLGPVWAELHAKLGHK